MKRHPFPGEFALILALLSNSLAVSLFVWADFGLSVVSGVPYVLSLVFPRLSLGTWNALMQCGWLLVLSVGLRRVKVGYVMSFALAAVFGALLDGWGLLLAPLPHTMALRLAGFAAGYALMATGIALLLACGLPVLPFDTVPRELVAVLGWSVRKARTAFDLVNLAMMLGLGLIFLGRAAGIGWGSVFNALLMGTGAGYVSAFLRTRLDIRPRITLFAKMV